MSIAVPDLAPLARIRRKLAVFSVLSLVAPAVGLPGWTVAALVLTSLAIPAAVGLTGGRHLLRELLRPQPGTRTARATSATCCPCDVNLNSAQRRYLAVLRESCRVPSADSAVRHEFGHSAQVCMRGKDGSSGVARS